MDQQQRRKQEEGCGGQYEPARDRRAPARAVHVTLPSFHPHKLATGFHPGKGPVADRIDDLPAVEKAARAPIAEVAPRWPSDCLPLRTGARLLIFVPDGTEQVSGSSCRWRRNHRISPGPVVVEGPVDALLGPISRGGDRAHACIPPLLPSVAEMLLAPEGPGSATSEV